MFGASSLHRTICEMVKSMLKCLGNKSIFNYPKHLT